MPTLRKPDRSLTISEVCREFSVTSRAVRFYEEQGLLEPPRKGGVRVFAHRDRTRLKLIRDARRVGLSIQDIAEIFALRDRTDGDVLQSRLALEKFERQLEVLLRRRDEIDDTMATLQQACEALEGELRLAGDEAGVSRSA